MTTRTFGVAAAGTLVALASLVCLFAGPERRVVRHRRRARRASCSAPASCSPARSATAGSVRSSGSPRCRTRSSPGLFAPGEVDALGDLGNAHLLSGFTTITLAAMVAMVGISDAVHLFLGTTAAGTLGAIGAIVVAASDLEPAGAAALVAGAATALTPLLPAVSLRLAQLPLPHIPTDPDDVRHDEQPAYDATLLDQAHAADQFLTGLVSASAIVVAVCDLLLVLEGGAWGFVLVARHVVVAHAPRPAPARPRPTPGAADRRPDRAAPRGPAECSSGAARRVRIVLLAGGIVIGAIACWSGCAGRPRAGPRSGRASPTSSSCSSSSRSSRSRLPSSTRTAGPVRCSAEGAGRSADWDPVSVRRDQVDAQKYVNRRLTNALLTSDANAQESPLRSVSRATIVSAVVGALVVLGFLAYGFVSRGGNTDWQEEGAVVVARESGTRFVYLSGLLHPVANLTSARLIAGGGERGRLRLGELDRRGRPR